MNYAVQRLIASMRARSVPLDTYREEHTGADYRSLRDHNRSIILNCIRAACPIPRVVVSRTTRLSRTTVSHIVDELLAEGFVREGGTIDPTSNGGRPAISVHFQADLGYILGVDVGRTHLSLVATNMEGVVKAHQSGPFALGLGPAVCVPELIARLREFAAANDIPWDSIVGIGLGIPGTLAATTRIFSKPPHLPGWDGVDLHRELDAALDVPVYLDNDANLGALGECRYGIGRTYDNFVYLKIGTGIGTGIIIDRHVYRGYWGFAGEIGHVIIGEDGPQCDCGIHGCLETLAGADAIVADARQGLSAARIAPDHRPTPSVALKHIADPDISDVIRAAQAGDVACRAAIEHAGQRIGVALSSLINILNPAAIIFDGSVSKAGDILLSAIRRTASAITMPAAWEHTQLITGMLDNMAIAMGGVATVIDEAFEAFARPPLLPAKI